MLQKKKVAIYARVSTQDQDCSRQLFDLEQLAERAGYEVVGVFQEKASGMKNDRSERKKVLALAQKRLIDAILVTEMSRWGRSTQDLISTLNELQSWNVSVIAQNGMNFDLSTPQGKMITSILAAFSEFERDLITERVKSGVARAQAAGKHCGRPTGKDLSKDKQVMKLIREGRSYRWIAHEVQISPTTVNAIARRNG